MSRPKPHFGYLEYLRCIHGDAYRDYTERVSPDNMAVSIRVAAYLMFLCKSRHALRVADFGSGFTSYILATYAAETDEAVTVTSVDDDEEWLKKTGEFLAERDLHTNLTMWSDYQDAEIHHDVACYDLGSGAVRDGGMDLVVRRTRPGGVVLFDDANHLGHRKTMREIAERYRFDLYGLQAETTDMYGRYDALMVRP